MSQLTLTDADRSAQDWFRHTTNALGCRVEVDGMVSAGDDLTLPAHNFHLTCSYRVINFAVRMAR